jgi:hypothetical protein
MSGSGASVNGNCSSNNNVNYVNNSGYMKYQVPTNKPPQNHVLIPLKTTSNQANPYGRYSAFAEMDNYIHPPPQAFVQEKTITKTTIITTKSTENLISNAQYNLSDESCECLAITQQQQQHQPQQQQHCSPKPIVANNCIACNAGNFNHDQSSYQGYYSNLTRNNPNRYIPTKTEITRL